MPRLAANLSMMYTELPFLDRFEAAAKDGFKGVEYLFPYAFPAHELAARLKGNGLQQVLFNAPPGGTDAASIDAAWAANMRGTASLPGHEAQFRAGVSLALAYADALDCPRIHLMAGLLPAGASDAVRSQHRDTYVANLAWGAEQIGHTGRDTLIEPINTRDIPGFFLNRQDEAHAIVQQVGRQNLKVQMDLYHCQIVEGDVAMKIRQYLPGGSVGHFQIAGVPQRQEPDIGELNNSYLLEVIDEVSAACGMALWVGCEYKPRLGGSPGGTSAGLGWFAKWR